METLKPWDGSTPYDYKTAWLRPMSRIEWDHIIPDRGTHLRKIQQTIRAKLKLAPLGWESIFRSVFPKTWVTSRTPTVRALCGLDALPKGWQKNYKIKSIS